MTQGEEEVHTLIGQRLSEMFWDEHTGDKRSSSQIFWEID